MPFQSEAQRRLMWAKHPKIARRWAKKYGGGKGLPKHKRKKVTLKFNRLHDRLGRFARAVGRANQARLRFRKSPTARLISTAGNTAALTLAAGSLGVATTIPTKIAQGLLGGRAIQSSQRLARQITDQLSVSKRPKIRKLGKFLGTTGSERGYRLVKRASQSRNPRLRRTGRAALRLGKWLHKPRVDRSGRLISSRGATINRYGRIALGILSDLSGYRAGQRRREWERMNPKTLHEVVVRMKAQSTEAKLREVRSAFSDQFRPNGSDMLNESYKYYYCEDIWLDEGYLICHGEGKYFRVDFTKKEGKYEFTPKDQWKEMEQTYVAKARRLALLGLKTHAAYP